METDKQSGFEGFRVSLVGPSRVGKTSLITSILSAGRKIFEATPVSVNPGDDPTEVRISKNLNELRACLADEEFNAASLSSTQDATKFHLIIAAGKEKIDFHVLDFPGEWLKPGPARSKDGWKEYKEWLHNSSVLVVPIDATLVMQAMKTHKERSLTTENLQIEAVVNTAVEWAKARAPLNEPSLLLFCPVKCETYFPVEPNDRNLADKLYKSVMDSQLYGGVRDKVVAEWAKSSAELRMEYHPVGTLGCVEYSHGRFEDGVFVARYRKRVGVPEKGSAYGAGGLLASIVRPAVSEAKNNPGGGLLTRLWKLISGDNKLLAEALNHLAEMDLGPRVREVPRSNRE